MKKILLMLGCVFIITISYAQNKPTVAQNANSTLSNLANPTKINVSLLPNGNDNHNIGNSNYAWRNLFLDSNIYVGGTRFISTPVNNSIAIGFNALKKIGQGNVNVAVGSYALSANTTGSSNVAFGSQVLYSNTTTSYNTAMGTFTLFNNVANGNTAVGYAALLNNSTGYSNVAIGTNALQSNTTGHNNIAIGDSALFHQVPTITDDLQNIAIGSKALYSNTTGLQNLAVGYNALYNNTTANLNTAIGLYTLYSNTTGFENVAVGETALELNTTGYWNTATGREALFENTTGYANTAIGDDALLNNVDGYYNTAIGNEALQLNISGILNTATGEVALYYNHGVANTADGAGALYNNADGSENTATGENAGYNITTGSYNTFLGYEANSGSTGAGNNMMALGNGATVTSNNHIVIGNSSVTSIGGYENWTKLSDGRVKKNIKQNVPGLSFINKLQPITYNLDLDAADKIINRPLTKDKNGKIVEPSQFETDSRKAKEKIIYTGFIAQDVEAAAKSLNYDFSGVDKPDNANTLYGLRYSDFVVPLVKAVQELSKQNDSLKNDFDKKLAAQQKEIDELKAMIVNQSTVNGQQSAVVSSALLFQNVPNPFSNSTAIRYSLPAKFSSAKIIITDKNGNALKTISLANNKGSVNVDAATLSSGAYQYSLYVDGRLIDTKQMILSK